MDNIQKLSPYQTEYRVIPVTRYLMTRFVPFWDPRPGCGGMNSSEKVCEFESEEEARKTAGLLTEAEFDRVKDVMALPNRDALISAHLQIQDAESAEIARKFTSVINGNGAVLVSGLVGGEARSSRSVIG